MGTAHYFQRVALEKLKLAISSSVSLRDLAFLRNHAECEVLIDHATRSLVMRLTSFVLVKERSETGGEVKWPASWWQALKERWFPCWAKHRWPVRYERRVVTTRTYHCCPHLDIQTDERRQLHFAFLLDVDRP